MSNINSFVTNNIERLNKKNLPSDDLPLQSANASTFKKIKIFKKDQHVYDIQLIDKNKLDSINGVYEMKVKKIIL